MDRKLCVTEASQNLSLITEGVKNIKLSEQNSQWLSLITPLRENRSCDIPNYSSVAVGRMMSKN